MPLAFQTNLRTDYVNANYMNGYNNPRQYIATQGPVPDSFNSFAFCRSVDKLSELNGIGLGSGKWSGKTTSMLLQWSQTRFMNTHWSKLLLIKYIVRLKVVSLKHIDTGPLPSGSRYFGSHRLCLCSLSYFHRSNTVLFESLSRTNVHI
jgi:hypothetical protein